LQIAIRFFSGLKRIEAAARRDNGFIWVSTANETEVTQTRRHRRRRHAIVRRRSVDATLGIVYAPV